MHFRNTIFTTTFFFFISPALFAQRGTQIGIYAGPNLASQTISPMYYEKESIFSFHFAGLLDLPVAKKLFLQPAISLQGKGVRIKTGNMMDGPEGSTLNMMYLEIPVTILFKVPVKRLGTLVTGAGPYASLGLTGKEVYDSQHTVSNIFKSKLGSNGYNRTDFGFNFQAGTQLNSNITLAIRHGLGINNIAPEPYTVGPGNENRTKGVIKNQVSSFSIGYLF